MNRIYIIAALFTASVVFQACEKDEFENLIQEETGSVIEAKETTDQSSSSSANDDDGQIIYQAERSDEGLKLDDNLDGPVGFVKEVSDGDEESDDDENTSD